MQYTLLDGGMGQELMARSGSPATPLWSADILAQRPGLVEDVHADFIEAGADIITVNAYSATPTRLAKAGREKAFHDLQARALDAARRARERTNKAVRIAGCLPPLPGSYRPEDFLGVKETSREYERIVAAQEGGVDLFLCETLSSIEEARLATRAARSAGKIVWTALTLDEADGSRLRSGESVTEAADAAVREGAEAVLFNCCPPETIGTALDLVAGRVPASGAYANGFTTVTPLKTASTVDVLEARRDLGPDAYAAFAKAWAEAGASIIGGCCEIGPAHIARLNTMRSGPRRA